MTKKKEVKKRSGKISICTICGEPYQGFGNCAWPIAEGRCCDFCNSGVLVARARYYKGMKK